MNKVSGYWKAAIVLAAINAMIAVGLVYLDKAKEQHMRDQINIDCKKQSTEVIRSSNG